MNRSIRSLALTGAFFVAIGTACKEEEKPVVMQSAKTAPVERTARPLMNDTPAARPKAGPVSPDASLPPGHPPIGDQPPIEQPPQHEVKATAGELTAAGLSMSVSEDWQKQTPSMSLRLAQYSLPGKAGAAEFVVYCFGPGQGGPVDANIKRWEGQFSDPANPDAPVKSESSTFDQNGLKVTIVKAHGSYAGMKMGPAAGAAPKAQADQALYGVIIEGSPAGNVFVKVTGPAETVEAQTAALEKMAHSVKPAA